MYAIRFSKFLGKVNGQLSFSKKPDGMFLRNDGGHTDHKSNAKVFETLEAAMTEAPNVAKPYAVVIGEPRLEARVFVVEVTTKPVIHTQISVVCEF